MAGGSSIDVGPDGDYQGAEAFAAYDVVARVRAYGSAAARIHRAAVWFFADEAFIVRLYVGGVLENVRVWMYVVWGKGVWRWCNEGVRVDDLYIARAANLNRRANPQPKSIMKQQPQGGKRNRTSFYGSFTQHPPQPPRASSTSSSLMR